jgi:hypothetical protein
MNSILIDCPFAEIKMTFSNFGQKTNFCRQVRQKLPKAAVIFAGLPDVLLSPKAVPARYGNSQSIAAIYGGKINSRFQKNFSER